jgi:hypothetical protein
VVAFVAVALVNEALVIVPLVIVDVVTVSFVAVRFVAMTDELDAMFTTIDVPVALVNVSAARSANEFSLSVFAETAPAKVDVPAPAATVIAPPNVEVAVDVAIRFPRIV